nr:hypothetical protein [uncultured Acetatifactor sp.]
MFVQIISDSAVIVPLDAHIKDISDHFCRCRIYHQFSFSLLVPKIAIYRKASYVVSTFLPYFYLASHFDGNITAVRIVHEVFERQDDIICLAVHMFTVIVVIDGNKAHSHEGENLLDISSCLNLITAKAR